MEKDTVNNKQVKIIKYEDCGLLKNRSPPTTVIFKDFTLKLAVRDYN